MKTATAMESPFTRIIESKRMIARALAAFAVLIALATLNVPPAQASVEPIVAVNSFFAALNSGDQQAAVDVFTPDAIATLARGETYGGQAEIADMVQLLGRPGRHYEIVQVRMVGDTVSFKIEISDQGIRWGEATIVAEVRTGKLHTFDETALSVRIGS